MNRLLALPLFLLATACSGSKDDDGGRDFVCGDAAPVLGEIQVTDGGTGTIGGTERRLVAVSTIATDDDGDLFEYTAQVWYDTLVDGKLPERPQVTVTQVLDEPNPDDTDGPCPVASATVGAKIPLGDDAVPAGTQVEFGLVIYDAAGNPSNGGVPTIVFADTPEL